MGFCGSLPLELQSPPYLSPCRTYPAAAALLLLVAIVAAALQLGKLRALARLPHPAQVAGTHARHSFNKTETEA